MCLATRRTGASRSPLLGRTRRRRQGPSWRSTVSSSFATCFLGRRRSGRDTKSAIILGPSPRASTLRTRARGTRGAVDRLVCHHPTRPHTGHRSWRPIGAIAMWWRALPSSCPAHPRRCAAPTTVGPSTRAACELGEICIWTSTHSCTRAAQRWLPRHAPRTHMPRRVSCTAARRISSRQSTAHTSRARLRCLTTRRTTRALSAYPAHTATLIGGPQLWSRPRLARRVGPVMTFLTTLTTRRWGSACRCAKARSLYGTCDWRTARSQTCRRRGMQLGPASFSLCTCAQRGSSARSRQRGARRWSAGSMRSTAWTSPSTLSSAP
mmetsp:Transcript_46840/g.156175  ORF Transcript_46840/g.156175 Transcript_46840/m.156175 type:complete len:323 (-) Transcript_46840:63-1031(-)